jgi:hypothetical protein
MTQLLFMVRIEAEADDVDLYGNLGADSDDVSSAQIAASEEEALEHDLSEVYKQHGLSRVRMSINVKVQR